MTRSRYRPPPRFDRSDRLAAHADGLEGLRNLGPRSAAWLREAGIADAGDLRRLGAAAAYVRVKRTRPEEVTRTLLWALAGALLDCPYTRLPVAVKAGLVAQVRGLPTPPETEGGSAAIGPAIAGMAAIGEGGSAEEATP